MTHTTSARVVVLTICGLVSPSFAANRAGRLRQTSRTISTTMPASVNHFGMINHGGMELWSAESVTTPANVESQAEVRSTQRVLQTTSLSPTQILEQRLAHFRTVAARRLPTQAQTPTQNQAQTHVPSTRELTMLFEQHRAWLRSHGGSGNRSTEAEQHRALAKQYLAQLDGLGVHIDTCLRH